MRLTWRSHLTLIILVFATLTSTSFAQEDKLQPGDRQVGLGILADVYSTIKGQYYDPKFHGMDLQARYKETAGRIDKATSFNQILGLVGWFVDSLDDTHTFFIPPPRAYIIEYGWRLQMIGDQCYVTHVRPGSDAEKQGLAAGDRVESIMGIPATRDDLRKIQILLQALRPQPMVRLVVQSPTGAERTLDLQAAIKPTRHQITNYSDWMDEVRHGQTYSALYDRKSVRVGDVLIWKLYDFDINDKGADAVVGKARESKALILDLRGNPGGDAEGTIRMISNFFAKDVKVADPQGRKKIDLKTTAKGRGDKAYGGKLIVLVDSDSASASEILARVVQLEGRGTIVGDRSAGAVMLSTGEADWHGLERSIFYGMSVTKADMIMEDGKSLEHVGVVPDVVALPTPADLASGRDPVLARAVELGGGTITPEDAGKLFPYKWPPQ